VIEESHKLGEVLRSAREAKGVDLARVERETKIRERYLSALERGEYRDLPGSVYTKGFLRNYGAYLGLDPDYLIDLYRIETSATPTDRPRAAAPPRPLAVKRPRTFVVTPGAVVAAILTLMVGGLVAYLGWEFVNFARTPELRITDPAGNVSAHTELTITVRGTTVPNARVAVSNLTENPTITADGSGSFQFTVSLRPGSNVMEVTATDPVTGRESEVEERTIVVVTESASPSPTVAITLDQPTADATITGPVPIAGTAGANASLGVTATPAGAPQPTFEIRDPAGATVDHDAPAPVAPGPSTIAAAGDGTFAGEVALGAGTWDIAVAAEGSEPVVRRVTVVPGDGLRATLLLVDGDSYLELEQNGNPVADVSGTIAEDGDRLSLRASRELRIRVGNAGAVRLAVNGINLGVMGGDGEVVEWIIRRTES
jgi:cytoskeletal protein RodZ